MFGAKKLFIFDLDGTLADVYKAIYSSLNYTREKLGYSGVSFPEVKRSVGTGDINFIAHFFLKRDRRQALAIYRARHKRDVWLYSRPLPGALAAMRRLKRSGKIVAVASNRPRLYARKVIEKTGLDRYVDFALSADQINSLKPKPKILNLIVKKFGFRKKEAIYFGDMDIDMETARRAGIDAVFVRGGSGGAAPGARYRILAVVNRVGEIKL